MNTQSYEFNVLDYINKNYLFNKSEDTEVQQQALAQIGFIAEKNINASVNYKFNQNVFAKYLAKVITGVQDVTGNLYIYNQKGFYELADGWIVGKIIKYLTCQLTDLWSQSIEQNGIQAYLRDIKKIVKDFNKADIVNVANGVLEIQNMKLEKHNPNFYSTIQLPINYDSSANCPKFLQFIQEITGNDKELNNVIQEMVGYCLCHNVKAEKAFFLYGSGKNGKSVLAKIIEQLVGSQNVSSISLQRLGENFGIASMLSKNVNISPENEIKGKLNTQVFKSIVSGDTININRKYKEDVQCSLSCKLIMLVNNLPDTTDFTYGYFRKILIIPFNKKFEHQNQDVNLYEKLIIELPGILNWALQGLKRLQANSYQFSVSMAINNIMQSYNNEQNPTAQFFNEFYEENQNEKIKKSDLYNDYQFWMNENGLEAQNKQTFWKMLKIKAEESNSTINLKYKRIHGIDYLNGYRRKYAVKTLENINITY